MIAGRYSLDAEIGRGGMGIVWRGRDETLGRDVALKRIGLAPGGSSPDLKRAEREARLAATLHHPNVVSVFDLAVEGDEHWLVMEYVESRNLAQIVKEKGPLPLDTAARLLSQVADALAAAHELGIVHRDVKPSNILVTPSGDAKITDFGIARAKADATLTQTGMVTGSPAYLPPEIASGKQAGPASDVWSLGATLYHLLSGHPPYDVSENVVGALFKIVHEEPPRLDDAGWLAPVLEATMATEPDDRWTMSQVRDVLRAGPDDATRVAPTTPPPAERTRTVAAAPAPGPRIAPEPAKDRRRRNVGPLVAVAAVVVAVALLLWAISSRDDTPAAGGGGSPSPSQSQQPEESSPTQDAADEGAMSDFIDNYVSTAPEDPKTTWEQLTPGFQDASGGFGSYKKFWGSWESASASNIEADGEALTVSYDVEYTKKDGSTTDDSVTLQLEENGDSFLIAGES